MRVKEQIDKVVETTVKNLARLTRYYEQYPGVREANLKRIPLGYFGKSEDIAGAAIYLASDASGSVTGASIVIDGGQAIYID